MINDSMKSNKLIGMIQPKSSQDNNKIPELHKVGCLGKIKTFSETEDGRYLIELKGIVRFQKVKELKTEKKYRILNIDYEKYTHDLSEQKENLKFSDLNLFLKI